MERMAKKGDRFGKWTLQTPLNHGGNGEVWRVYSETGESRALKLLRKPTPTALKRFRAEVKAVTENTDVKGILRIIDHSVPTLPEGGPAWYVMPEAVSLQEHLSRKSETEIAAVFARLAKTLAALHKRGVVHRDIKPSNLFFHNDRPRFADFGLVDFPDKEDITQRGHEVGAKWTIAPEMRRDASSADGRAADVYSLAKTLWICLAKVHSGFDGQYSPHDNMRLSQYVRGEFLEPLDELLASATQADPERRPTAHKFAKRLTEWIEMAGDFHKQNTEQWRYVQAKLFPQAMPDHVRWSHVDEIVDILSFIGKIPNLNHMFFPDGGGLDLSGCCRASEANCIELKWGGLVSIVRPESLAFEGFGKERQWNYFRLECMPLEPILEEDREGLTSMDEELVELGPGEYIEREHWDSNEYCGEPLPKGARLISRYLSGAFVCFAKRSPYNLEPGTYDARHNKMTAVEFRSYIERHARALRTRLDRV